jgi:hypothetical protein
VREPVRSNSWRGEPADGPFAEAGARRWGVGPVPQPTVHLAPIAHDPWDWRHTDVGWGLLLADDDADLPSEDLALARDAPEPLQELVAARGPAPVLRWHPDDPDVLLRYYPGYLDPEAIPIGGSPRGVRDGAIPSFLMIWGELAKLPWQLQYRLNLDPRVCAGRLPLTGDALARYVRALLGEWDRPAPSRATALVWATDHAATDITRLMRTVIADEVHQRYAADEDIAVTHRSGPDATAASLAAGLGSGSPRMIVTTSHGFTGPIGKPEREQLGWLVDADFAPIDPTALLAGWQPDGAVWYAHACCGAGSDAPSAFTGLFHQDSGLHRMITEVAALGSRIAPLPLALLSAPKPLRAFIGHVEPTFDWTIRHAASRHALTADLVQGLYTELMLGRPVGWAMAAYHTRAGADAADHDTARARALAGRGDAEETLRPRLSYLDRRSLVILGDPCAALPSTAIR